MDWLRSYRPDLVDRYETLYARGAYAPQAERERLMKLVRHGPVSPLPSPTRDHRGVRRPASGRFTDRRADRAEEVTPPRRAVQTSLF
jgi:hypothetical protein